jgi:predicted Rossmann fold flavoprotein
MDIKNRKIERKKEFDVIVIGGGPAGLISAGRAGELGSSVILFEKNKTLGKKLLLTGKGRSNITNANFNLKELTKKYGKNGKFLFHSFSFFGPKEVIDFFNKRGLKTKIERGERVFPISNRAQDVLKVLINYLIKNKVILSCNSEVVKITMRDNSIKKITVKTGNSKDEVTAKNYIICTGGLSYPITGSNGNGFKWARDLGHSVIKPSPALTAIKIKESWIKDLQGLSLKNVEVNVKTKDKIKIKEFGECLFTHFGLSGPIILNISKKIGELLKDNNEIKLSIDLKPSLDLKKLDERIQRDLSKHQNKSFKNCLDDLLPKKLIPIFLEKSKINPEKKGNSVTKIERKNLLHLFKNFELTVISLIGFESAIVTAGGVSLKEIDDKTMKSKKINNLFFAGEIIDIDGPTGGYNLQNCWSTGYLAGENASKIY